MFDVQSSKMSIALALGAVFSIIMIEYPRAFAFMPALFALVHIFSQSISSKVMPHFSWRSIVPLLVIWSLGFSSVFWSVDLAVSLERCIKLGPVMLIGFVIITWALNQPTDLKRSKPYFYGIAIMVILGALITIFELNADKAFYKFLRDLPEDSKFSYAVYNRGTVILTLLTLSLLGYFLYIRRSIKALSIIILCLTFLMLQTDSQSAQLALVLALLFFFLFPYGSRVSWYALMLFIAFLIISAPHVAPWLYGHAEYINSLPFLGGNMGYAGPRLEIWDYVARYALDSPILGYGLEATKVIEDFDSKELYLKGNTILHPHNFALQLWIEFGAVGALGCVSLILWMLYRISKLPYKADKQVCLSSFIAVLSVSSTGYGIWQGWWLGTVFFTTATILYFVRLEKTD